MRKILFLALAALFILLLCACGGTESPSGDAVTSDSGASSSSGSAASPDGGGSPAQSGETFTFTMSVMDPQGSLLDEYFVQPFQKLLDEKTGGRVQLEVFYAASLTQQGNSMEAVKNGIVDIAQDVPAMYPGQFLFTELIGTPGFNFGGHENFSRVVNEFGEAYYEPAFDPFVIVARFAFGDFGIETVDTPVYSSDDVRGLMLRTSSQIIPWYEAMGASASFLPMSEVYESLRLSVINGVHTSIGSIQAFKLAEVTNYYTLLPMHCGDSVFVMSKDLYNSLPADIQTALDATFAEMLDIGINFAYKSTEVSMEACFEQNPDFQFVELTDTSGLVQAAEAVIQDKVDEINAAGLDGDGAYQWLMARTVG